MSDFIDDAKEEIKRADHLIFVSLKYTRTCDVLKHIVERFINCLDACFSAILEFQKENGKLDIIPKAPIVKAKKIKEFYPKDKQMVEFADYFVKLRKISKADFGRACEFRRHVTMSVEVEGEKIDINIDTVTEDFKNMKEFFEHVKTLVNYQEEQ